MAISEIEFEMESSGEDDILSSSSLKMLPTDSNSFASLMSSDLTDSESNELFASLASIQECERYFESKNLRDEKESSFRNSFSGILSSQNNSALKHSSSRLDSDHSSKRFKSSTTEAISFLISDEDPENRTSSHPKIIAESQTGINEKAAAGNNAENVPESMIYGKNPFKGDGNNSETMNCIKDVTHSGFVQGSFDENDCVAKNSKNEARFLSELISSLSTMSQQEDNASTGDSNEIATDMKEKLKIDGLKEKPGDREDFVYGDEQNREHIKGATNLNFEMHNYADSGFVTGKNKKIYVKPEAVEINSALFYGGVGVLKDQKYVECQDPEDVNKDDPGLEHNKYGEDYDNTIRKSIENKIEDNLENDLNMACTTDISPGYVDSGFKTGKSKKILIAENSNLKEDKNHVLEIKSVSNHRRRFNIPEKSHASVEMSEEDTKMMEIYNKIKKEFEKEDSRWIHQQFKWCWMHLLVNQMVDNDLLENEIASLMKFKLQKEYSILRRIVEFDDLSFRFMILGIIGYGENSIDLFDGFYSLSFEIDKNIFNKLRQAMADLGTKLYVFGSSLLLKSPTGILDATGCCMKLHYNSVKICLDDSVLGKSGKISFLNKISSLRSDGGVVSALVVKVKRIVELKYLVTVENYRNRVEDLEAEIEKIYEIARKADFTIDPKKILCKQFCKMIVADESGDCLLTWWSPPEIRVSDVYKFVYLIPVENSMGLHLSTNNKTYYEKVNA